jgi:hypothetical protein
MLKVFIIIIICIIIFIYIEQPPEIIKALTQIQALSQTLPKAITQAQEQTQTQTQTQTQSQESELIPSECSEHIVYGKCKNIYGLDINCEKNTSGIEKGTRTITYNVIPGIKCPEPSIIGCDINCDVDCVGEWKNVGSCKIDSCNPKKNTEGLGKQTQFYDVKTLSKNEGKVCLGPTKEVPCYEDNYIGCTQCGGMNGSRVIGATCDNIKTCENLLGVGERIDKWSSTSYTTLPGCIIPPNSKVKCSTDGEWSNCNCSYDISSNSFCNETNTVCKANGSECTVNYTKQEPLPQQNNAPGICTVPIPKHYNVNLDKCECTVIRNFGDWIYTNPRCDPSNRTTFIADKRSRPITIIKTGGNKACIFPKISNNETINKDDNIEKGIMNPNGSLQFGENNDLKGSTFHTTETENNINFADNINCKCEGTYENWTNWSNWTNDTICPSVTNYIFEDSAFNITQSRTRKRTFKISNSSSLFDNYSCPQEEDIKTKEKETHNYTCPRNCLGVWSNWSECNTGCPGNATTNSGISTKTASGGQATQIRTFIIDKGKTALGIGEQCTNQHGNTGSKSCNTGVACTINCTGGYWDNWTPCTAPVCNSSITETESTKTGTQIKNWIDAIGPFNNGTPCPTSVTNNCSRTCQIDCKGTWDTNYSGCTATCSPASTETDRTRYGTEYKYFNKISDPINNGAVCPTQADSRSCSKSCDVDCTGSWSDSNNALGLGYKTYTRRANSNVGNCPANNDGEVTPSQAVATGIPKNSSGKFIHPRDGWPANGWQIVYWENGPNENRLKWNFLSDGRIHSVHKQNNNTDLYLRPNRQESGSDIVFSNTSNNGNSHRWRKRSNDGKIEYMGSSNYRPTNLCIHTSSNFNNDSLAILKDCSEANSINLV